MVNAIITMAGLGKRFRDAGYNIPKYCIDAHGKTLFEWSMLSLRNFIQQGASFFFIVRAEDQAVPFIRRHAAQLGIRNVQILEIDHVTDGQATSAMLAGPLIADSGYPILIYNIDTFVHPDSLPAHATRGDGWVPCFPGKGEGWSFAAATPDKRITEIREKVRISPHATIGLYWFSSLDLYRKVYADYYSDTTRVEKGEKYIAPMYNQIIRTDGLVYLHELPFDSVIPLGTPEEVAVFLRQDPPAL
ncbi:MAG TPA: glycosyltransferase family 2 protein [Noviherbaspirillum sp.]|uniref:glycosyltransferase family 2 protein n=1 Tax=Noviherbaspirillum sp. TaxID=1926288 RepID=UPI002D392F81|nr:glycosyltransferase family 2 protein [Noviherbaspirillum sp.]HYD95996.1 glycosyltransferase family 2 protein [Noviherbaspirillum sp.]